jgi:predicted RecB family nuclease
MEQIAGDLRFSATDLVGHLNCRHLTELDRAVATGTLARPHVWDPLLEALWERGARHEQAYIDHLAGQGLTVTTIPGIAIDAAAEAETLAAMRAGAPVIVQAALRSGRWTGRADVLRRVETPSALGAWSYEPYDTKLAQDTKAGAVLQLCLYAELLAATQAAAPEHVHVVTPWTDFRPQTFRVDDYGAYFRQVRASLEAQLDAETIVTTYPEPVEHCDVCRWRPSCGDRRRTDDHLSLVAGISKAQASELRAHGVTTMAGLAALPLPWGWKPERGARESYERVREQARIQVQGRAAGETRHELLPVLPDRGLSRLPAPSDGDLFLDLEGDPFVGEAGLEYLFGYAWRDDAGAERCTSDWALSRDEERAVFERFVDFAINRLEHWPDLHIYHFAPYEPAALKRLMGRYATREAEVDRLLRAQVFVDLFAVARHAIRASVESYSIKKLEPLYGFIRDAALPDANAALATLQVALELGDPTKIDPAVRGIVQAYNRDDCISTWRLRDWLEARRDEVIASGVQIDRPQPVAGAAPEDVTAWTARIAPIIAALTQDVPADPADRTADQHGRWLLANILDWHRREKKAAWWEFFRLRDLTPEDLLDERAAIAGLAYERELPKQGRERTPVHRYRFPAQDADVSDDAQLYALGGARVGTVADISTEEGWIDIKKRGDTADVHPEAIFAHRDIKHADLANSLARLGEHVAAHGLAGEGPYQPARDLLLRALPRVGGENVRREGEAPLDAALRLAADLPAGVLPVQGPPGAGKTFTGARMICRLAAAGKTVGITANSHAVIRNLIDEVLEAAKEMRVDVRCLQKPKGKVKQDDLPGLRFVTSNDAAWDALGPDGPVAGGTAWLWAPEAATGRLDVLVVDEAAQMSMANVLAVSQAAERLVLLGDPRQLEQPLQGSHPDGTEVSALHHLLDGRQTIAPDRGLFLAETYRLHPEICAFTSELFYERRLTSRAGRERQTIENAGPLSGHGLRHLAVPHTGNRNASPEEAERIAALVHTALAANPTWCDHNGHRRPLTLADILIITPYNAQLQELQARLPGAKIGTVDRFQGQQAPLVFYSMATSTPQDAPRGMEFLYSLNRLNVATSRAKCVCVVIASPALLAADCRTPRQMQLVNAFCRYLEMAAPIDSGAGNYR